jgi:hypothetical protein
MGSLIPQIHLGFYCWPIIRTFGRHKPGEFIILKADEFFDGRAEPESDAEYNVVSFIRYLMSNPNNQSFDAGVYLTFASTREYGLVPVLELMAKRHTDKPFAPKRLLACFPLLTSNETQDSSEFVQGYDSAKRLITLQQEVILSGGDNFRATIKASVSA